jgi:leucyl/phenylalanyl-tRNA--protein transferase
MSSPKYSLHWLNPGEPFPPVELAWGPDSDGPGLLAAGADLSVQTLLAAYSQGIFPWFSQGQPILWWSPDPRMVLETQNFKLHRSLKKELLRFMADGQSEIRFDSAFAEVISACAHKQRKGHPGTWIVPEMVDAYCRLHAAGYAHSVETWRNGELVGGLYCVAVGKAVFGESMFSHASNASKIALAGLVAFCKARGIAHIDCQQNTKHLASLGAGEIRRAQFIEQVHINQSSAAENWEFAPLYWKYLL